MKTLAALRLKVARMTAQGTLATALARPISATGLRLLVRAAVAQVLQRVMSLQASQEPGGALQEFPSWKRGRTWRMALHPRLTAPSLQTRQRRWQTKPRVSFSRNESVSATRGDVLPEEQVSQMRARWPARALVRRAHDVLALQELSELRKGHAPGRLSLEVVLAPALRVGSRRECLQDPVKKGPPSVPGQGRSQVVR